jgi:hypothetical protein
MLTTFEAIRCHPVDTKATAESKLGVSTFYTPRLTSCLFILEAVFDQNNYTICFVFRRNGCLKKMFLVQEYSLRVDQLFGVKSVMII